MFALPPASPITATRQQVIAPQSSAPAAPPAPAAQPEPRLDEVAAPTVVQQVSVQQTLSRSDLLAVDTTSWTWVELRDFVVAQITERFGPFPRDARKEYGIFSRFFNEYGQDGIRVAQYAFGPVCDGWWGKAPISINRFCKASDPYFVAPILARLSDRAD